MATNKKSTKQVDAGRVAEPSAAGAVAPTIRKYQHTPADRSIQYKAPREIYTVAAWNPTLFDNLPEKDRALWGGNSLDHLLKLYKLPPQPRALHTYFKGELYKFTSDILKKAENQKKEVTETEKEKPKRLTKEESTEILKNNLPEVVTVEVDTSPIFSMATGENYNKRGNGEKREAFNRQLVRWTGELSDAANIHILDEKGINAVHGHIYTKIICDAKRHKIILKMDRDYVIHTAITGQHYEQQAKAFSVAMGYNIGQVTAQGHKVGSVMYNYSHDFWSDSRNRDKAIYMETFMKFCGVPTLEDAAKNDHEARDVKEPMIDGIAIYKKTGVITYKWVLYGNEIDDETAKKISNDDYPKIRMVDIDFPGLKKRFPKQGNWGQPQQGNEGQKQRGDKFNTGTREIKEHYKPPTPSAA